MKLFDEDKISDEIVGSILFNLKDCIGDKVKNTNLLNIFHRMGSSFGRTCMDHH